MFKEEKFLDISIRSALLAGREILNVYTKKFEVHYKEDASPLTLADQKAHEVIEEALTSTQLPILSEEGNIPNFETRKHWEKFWLVDPLDGTKEFIAKSGEFTVNIALIEKNYPLLGVIYAPAKGLLYYAGNYLGAFKVENLDPYQMPSIKEIQAKSQRLPIYPNNQEYTVVASKNHMNQDTQDYIQSLSQKHSKITLISAGSSLKFCLVAEGLANEYPRLGHTMEWDTAAGQAIVNSAGKRVIDSHGDELTYNKESLRNTFFYVM